MLYTRMLTSNQQGDNWREAPSGEGNSVPFALSTPGSKRDNISLDAARFTTANFERNPVMLWMHGNDLARGDLPIGRWENITVASSGIHARAVFDPDDTFAVNVERKFRSGFLNAASIGWLNLDRDGNTVPWWSDDQVASHDLLEASAVSVPADPDALVEGRVFGRLEDASLIFKQEIEALHRDIRKLAWKVRQLDKTQEVEVSVPDEAAVIIKNLLAPSPQG